MAGGLTTNGAKKHVGIIERADLVATEKVGPSHSAADFH